MKFARDILLIDFETTGVNVEKDFPIQLSAVLLDKDNLLEKGSFDSYIRHPFSQTTNDRIVQTLGISKDVWMKSPGLKEVIRQFNSKFSYNAIIASQNFINVLFLQDSFKRAGLGFEYDYHVLDIWTLSYFFLAKQNIKKIPTASTIGSYFKLSKTTDHNSLENCRFLADILRKLTKSM